MAGWLKFFLPSAGSRTASTVPTVPTAPTAPAGQAGTSPAPGLAEGLAEGVARLKQSANAFLDAGNLAAAIADFQRATVQMPSDAGAWTGLGFALYESGKLQDAAAALTKVVGLDGASADAHFLLGNIARDQGDAARAQAAWRKALAHDPGLVPAWLELAQLLAREGDPAAAARLLDEAARHHPAEPGIHRMRGQALESAGQPGAAGAAFRQAVQADPAQLESRLDAARLDAQQAITDHFSAAPVTHGASPETPVSTVCKTLLVEGWRGVNHSYALINQYQTLEWLRRDDVRLFHRDLPLPNAGWSAKTVGAGFSAEDEAAIAGVPAPPGGTAGEAPGDGAVDAIYRICSPFQAPVPGDARCRTLSFLITEYGLVAANFARGGGDRSVYTAGGNLVITSSRWSRDRLVDGGFDGDCIHVVTCGVSREIFQPLPAAMRASRRSALGIAPEETVFLNLGAAFWNKGVDVLLHAFAVLRQRTPRVRLILKDQRALYGVPTVEAALRKLSGEHPALFSADTLNAIILLGSNLSQQQLKAVYGVADCYVSPYRAEGFNLPVLESLACGVPVIVTDGGSTDDFCPPGAALRVPSALCSRDDGEGGVMRWREPELDSVVQAMGGFADGGGIDRSAFDAATAALLPQKSWAVAAARIRRLLD